MKIEHAIRIRAGQLTLKLIHAPDAAPEDGDVVVRIGSTIMASSIKIPYQELTQALEELKKHGNPTE